MFDTVRAMVNQKTTFMETAEILYGESVGISDDLFLEGIGDNDDDVKDPLDDIIGDSDGDSGDDDDDAGDSDDAGDDEGLEDIGMNVKFSTDPSITEVDNILDVTIDIGTGTSPDTLPIPPINAADAILDDPLSARISDGFDAVDVSTNSEVSVANDVLNTEDPLSATIDAHEGVDFTEKAKAPPVDQFSIYGVSFTVPAQVSKFADSYEKSKLTDEIKNLARNNMVEMIKDPKNIAKIEKDILAEEQKIGGEDDTDEIRIDQIKKYLSAAKVGALSCSKSGKRAFLEIDIPYMKDVTCAWLEHGMYLASSGEVISFDNVDAYTEAVIMEAIVLDGEPVATGDEKKPAGDNNPVTDAVIDKVAESEPDAEPSEGEVPADDDLKVKLQDKLDKFQKDIIGLKDLVKKAYPGN